MTVVSGGGRPEKGYRTKDGKRVPSVTTITGRFKDAGGLIGWAYKMGLDGKDMNRERDNAGNAGTLAHDLIEGDILGKEPVLATAYDLRMNEEEYLVALAAARKGFEAYIEWRKSMSLEVIVTELPLVSEEHNFGGTLDAMARIGGKLAVLDWKSGGKVYPEHVVQCAAYAHLWRECRGESPEAIHVVRVGKMFGNFSHNGFGDNLIAIGWDAFKHMRALYDCDRDLKMAVG